MEKSCMRNFEPVEPVEKGNNVPKSIEEFCEMYNVRDAEFFIDQVRLSRNVIEHKAFICCPRTLSASVHLFKS